MSRHLFCEFTQAALYNTLSDFRAAVGLAAARQIGHWWEEEMGEGGASIVRRGGGSRPGLWGNRVIFVCFFQLQLFLRMIVTDTKTE